MKKILSAWEFQLAITKLWEENLSNINLEYKTNKEYLKNSNKVQLEAIEAMNWNLTLMLNLYSKPFKLIIENFCNWKELNEVNWNELRILLIIFLLEKNFKNKVNNLLDNNETND